MHSPYLASLRQQQGGKPHVAAHSPQWVHLSEQEKMNAWVNVPGSNTSYTVAAICVNILAKLPESRSKAEKFHSCINLKTN